ncbi:Ion-trans domain-containing protein [Aphelenchoides besseyi]|nr:Ion-trans domain-containing protein [Aphelenchoides besseyi]
MVTISKMVLNQNPNVNGMLDSIPPLSPDEQKARQSRGMLNTALKQTRSVSLNGLFRSTLPALIDSSDDEYRTGIIGSRLYGANAELRRRTFHDTTKGLHNSQTSDEDILEEYGSGILGRALLQEGRPFVNGRVGTPDFRRLQFVGKPGESAIKRVQPRPRIPKQQKVNSKIWSESVNWRKLNRSIDLSTCAKKGEWTEVRSILQAGDKFDFTISDAKGYNPLVFAVRASQIEIAELMLTKGADLYVQTKDRLGLAHIAARHANEQTVKWLMEKHVDFGKTAGSDAKLPIHFAAQRRSLRSYGVVHQLLRAHPNGRLAETRQGQLPLHLAIQASNLPVVQLLLFRQSEAQVRRADADKNTPLHLAARKNAEMIRTIAEAGGGDDSNTPNTLGRSPLHETAACGDEQMLKFLWKLKADANLLDMEEKSPLHVAAEKGRTAIVELLIDKFGASIRARTKDGSTMLHVASAAGHPDTALAFLKRGLLIARGTNADVRTKENYTALHTAVQSRQPSVVETLLGYGADVHVHGGQIGETALHVAAAIPGREIECGQMLLKSGANPNVTQTDGQTPLHICAKSGNVPMVQLLLNEGANPRLCSDTGETPLHVAARNCHCELAEIILQHLAASDSSESVKEYVNVRTQVSIEELNLKDGRTALHYAGEILPWTAHFKDEDAKLVSILIDYGGQTELQTYGDNETAMHLAARTGNEAVLLAIVNKIGAGLVQIVQNKKSKVKSSV